MARKKKRKTKGRSKARRGNHIPDDVLEARAKRLKRTVGGRRLIEHVLDQNT